MTDQNLAENADGPLIRGNEENNPENGEAAGSPGAGRSGFVLSRESHLPKNLNSYVSLNNNDAFNSPSKKSNDVSPTHIKQGPLKRSYLYWCYVIELIPAFAVGAQLTYGTIALPEHQKADADIALDINIGSWFVSLLSIFIVIGSLFSSLLSSYAGRRWCLFLSCNGITLGLACLQFAPSHHFLLAGRILAGLSVGFALPTSYLFVHETALPSQRSAMAAWNIFSLNSGNLYSLVVGWVVPYEFFPAVVAIPSVIFCVFIFTLPESPVFLLKKGDETGAKRALTRLWQNKYKVTLEIDYLKDSISREGQGDQMTLVESAKSRFTLPNIKALVQVTVLMMLQPFSGCDTIYNYMIVIAKMAELDINENLLSVMLQCGFNVGFILAPFLVERVNRKPHFMVTSLLAAASLFALGVGMSKGGVTVDEDGVKVGGEVARSQMTFMVSEILPVVSVISFSFLYGCGLGSLPFTQMNELLPEPVRNLGNSLATFVKYGSVFLLLKQFPAMAASIGLDGLFWFHAACVVVGAVFVQLCVPETRKRNEEELNVFNALNPRRMEMEEELSEV